MFFIGALVAACCQAEPAMMQLTIEGKNSHGAQVFIDGRLVGAMPLNDYPLTAKFHRIRLVKRGYLIKNHEVLGGNRPMQMTINLVPLEPEGAKTMPADLGNISDFDIQLAGDAPRGATALPSSAKPGVWEVRPGLGIGPFTLYGDATPVIRAFKLRLVQDYLPGKLRLYSGQGLSLLVAADNTIREISLSQGPLCQKVKVQTPQGNTFGPEVNFKPEFPGSYNIGSWARGVEAVWMTKGLLIRLDKEEQRLESFAVFPPKSEGWGPPDRWR